MIVMEYVENGDLESILLSEEREHPEIRKWSCRLKMSLEIAKGMDFLHSLNPSIIHRDLKTANVLVDCTYHCKASIHGYQSWNYNQYQEHTTQWDNVLRGLRLCVYLSICLSVCLFVCVILSLDIFTCYYI